MSDDEADTDVEAALAAAADELYAGGVDDFVARRTALSRAVAAEHGKPAGQVVAKLRKPSVAAWAVNLLVRREADQIDQVLGLAESLRAAAEALDGEELRALTRQRRQLTTALATTARRRAGEAGTRLSEPVVDQVEGVLTAAMLDPVAAQVVRTGRVVTAFTSTGMSELDVGSVVALPDALDRHATAVGDPEPSGDAEGGRPELHLVSDDGVRLAEAEEVLEQAREQLDQAEREREEVRAAMQDLDARRLQLQGDAEELRRRLAEIEASVDEVDDEREETEDALADADEVVAEARAEHERAAAEVARLQG